MFRKSEELVKVIARRPIQCVIGMNDLQVVNGMSNKLNFSTELNSTLC
ncbi:protein of unknown function [Xenorhabdus doucetiae]|uniref:Uncharacterized protein n=1 Tax=Xenorhabdus doucetiae TaxID=351671 RepID=A0A068QMZ5_9GAMM|nr:protein of unknown function [Xenorhabdus doucetiae]